MKTFFLMALLLVGSISCVYAARQVSEDLLELEYGENVTLNMEEFSRTTVRIYESSTLRINVEDVTLDLVLKNIREDGTTLVDVYKDGLWYNETTLKQGEQVPVRLDHQRLKAIFFEEKVLHYSADQKERNIQLFINIPLFKIFTGTLPYDDAEGTNASVEQPATGSAVQETQEQEGLKDPYLKYFFVIIGVLVVAIVTINPAKKKKR